MAIYSASDIVSKPKVLGEWGDATVATGKVVPTASVVTGDTLRLCIIPAGTEVNAVIIANASMGGPAPADIGYAPVSSNDGSLAANQTYFKAALALGTASDGTLEANFDPIKFEQDVYLTAVFGTVVAGTTGTARAIALGTAKGAK
jgi:hypothetical protein